MRESTVREIGQTAQCERVVRQHSAREWSDSTCTVQSCLSHQCGPIPPHGLLQPENSLGVRGHGLRPDAAVKGPLSPLSPAATDHYTVGASARSFLAEIIKHSASVCHLHTHVQSMAETLRQGCLCGGCCGGCCLCMTVHGADSDSGAADCPDAAAHLLQPPASSPRSSWARLVQTSLQHSDLASPSTYHDHLEIPSTYHDLSWREISR